MQFTAATAALVLAFTSTVSALPAGKDAITIPFMNKDCLRTCAATCVSDTGMDMETCATQICNCFDEKAYKDSLPFEFHQFGAQMEDPLTGHKPGQFTKAQMIELGIPVDKKINTANPTATMTKRPAKVIEPTNTAPPVAEKMEAEVKQGKVKEKTPVPEDEDEDEDETRALKDEDKEESVTLEDENRELKYETRVLKDKTRVLKDENRVLKYDIRALQRDINDLKDRMKKAEPPCGCRKTCNASGVCVCNECEIDCMYKTTGRKAKVNESN